MNQTLSFDDQDYEDESYAEPVPRWKPVLEIFISTMGLTLNIIAIFIIVKLKEFKKKISHWYVLQLAIADSIFLVMLPLRAVEDIKGEWVLKEFWCKIFQGVFMLNYFAGIFFLTMMSLDRYVAIVHPVNAWWNRFRTHKNAVIIAALVWTISAIFAIPSLAWSKINRTCDYSFPSTQKELSDLHVTNSSMLQDYVDFELSELQPLDPSLLDQITDPGADCKHEPLKSLIVWVWMNFLLAFAIPVAILIVCYSLILWRVLHPAIRSTSRRFSHRKNSDGKSGYSFRSSLSSSSSKSSANGLSQKQRVTCIVVTLVVVFITCWMPFHVEMLIKFKGLPYKNEYCRSIHRITQLLAYCNSMLNPIFYTFLGSKFKHRLAAAGWSFRHSRKSSHITAISHTPSCRNCPKNGGKHCHVTTDNNKAVDSIPFNQVRVTHAQNFMLMEPQDKFHLLSPVTCHQSVKAVTEHNDVAHSRNASSCRENRYMFK